MAQALHCTVYVLLLYCTTILNQKKFFSLTFHVSLTATQRNLWKGKGVSANTHIDRVPKKCESTLEALMHNWLYLVLLKRIWSTLKDGKRVVNVANFNSSLYFSEVEESSRYWGRGRRGMGSVWLPGCAGRVEIGFPKTVEGRGLLTSCLCPSSPSSLRRWVRWEEKLEKADVICVSNPTPSCSLPWLEIGSLAKMIWVRRKEKL